VLPCTVVCPGDMADNILDLNKHPDWQGERTKMLYGFPKSEVLWEKYAEIRARGLSEGRGITEATEFYRQNRAAMDEGAVVAWPERFDHDELSGLQHAMNKRLLDEPAFMAEYQNEPIAERTSGDVALSAAEILGKINGLGRSKVPLEAQFLSMFVDVQQHALYYAIVAWSPRFSGQVIEYGTYPDQKRAHFAYADVRQTLGGRSFETG